MFEINYSQLIQYKILEKLVTYIEGETVMKSAFNLSPIICSRTSALRRDRVTALWRDLQVTPLFPMFFLVKPLFLKMMEVTSRTVMIDPGLTIQLRPHLQLQVPLQFQSQTYFVPFD